jgi:hypothetical protein
VSELWLEARVTIPLDKIFLLVICAVVSIRASGLMFSALYRKKKLTLRGLECPNFSGLMAFKRLKFTSPHPPSGFLFLLFGSRFSPYKSKCCRLLGAYSVSHSDDASLDHYDRVDFGRQVRLEFSGT